MTNRKIVFLTVTLLSVICICFFTFYPKNKDDIGNNIIKKIALKNLDKFDEELNHFEKTIKNFKSNLLWTKEDIVKEFFTMIPDFGHKETGKYLDGKM